MPKKQVASAATDLGLLSDITHLERAGIIFQQAEVKKPLDLELCYSTQATNERIRQAETVYQKIAAANNNWLINSMMDGMNRLDNLEPGHSLDGLAPNTQKSVAAVH